MEDDLVLRLAHPGDKPYIKSLSRQESFALGWIPDTMYDRVWQGTFSGWILLCTVRQQPVGFCFAAPAYKPKTRFPPFYGRIYQLSVQADARRFEYGTALADAAHRLIMANGDGTTLRCACDLAANWFWGALGWEIISILAVGNRVGDSPRKTRRPLYVRLRVNDIAVAGVLPEIPVGSISTMAQIQKVTVIPIIYPHR